METKELSNKEETIRFIRNYTNYNHDQFYILSIIARRKENEHLRDSISFSEIIRTEQEIRRKYNKLLALSKYTPEEGNSAQFRMYLSVNGRDVQSAYRQFKEKLLESDTKIHTGDKMIKEQIKRLDKEWISTASKPESRKHNKFKIDLDTTSKEKYNNIVDTLKNHTTIILSKKSPSGYHIITRPFNYNKTDIFEENDVELEKDGQIFLKYMY